ncbi:MAG: hypothetical protein QOH70_2801 [Blastocatellia bacterium]|jgi:PAS domain S-box-containing protein|nr:hypothetical protein [Blastocatellia bacterium]
MKSQDKEEKLLRSVALENARSIRLARERAERELLIAQEALRESETWLRLALASAEMGTWRVNLHTGVATRDPNLKRILGLGNLASGELMQDGFQFVHPEDKAATIAAWQSAIANRAAYEAEFRVRREDGATLWLREQGRFIAGQHGTPDFMTGVTIDITTRKKSEEVQSTLAAIVESSADAIVSKDLNSIITSWNRGAERLFGYTAAETIGQPISILIPAERLNEEPNILKRIRRGERIEHYETIRRHKDGTLLDISLTVSPIFDARGRIVGASKIARDISARKRTEAELKTLITREREARAEAETANRVKDEFLAMVSHELRTPLNAIRGWTQLLKSGKLDQPQTERAIETIDRNAKAQVTIINELLDVAGIISGKLKLEMKPIYLAEVLSASLDVVRPAAAAKAIELVAVLDQTAGPVAAEPVRLQQVFWNLLTNAIKFTPKRGRIEVQLERAGSSVVVVVRDNGSGIPASFLPLIFDRFQQADTSARRAHGGLGLGLSIARNLVEMHGGTIRAESDGENRGARFTVTLPIIAIMGLTNDGLEYSDAVSASPTHEAEQQRVAVPQDGDLRSDSLRGVKVLAVDDQSETHDLIILALTRYGAEVRASTSVSAALKMIQDWQPDVLVSDIGMPGEDGYDLIRKIRALDPKNGGSIPALALTGYASPADESRARAAGYQTHMSKPVELRKLAERIVQLSGR